MQRGKRVAAFVVALGLVLSALVFGSRPVAYADGPTPTPTPSTGTSPNGGGGGGSVGK